MAKLSHPWSHDVYEQSRNLQNFRAPKTYNNVGAQKICSKLNTETHTAKPHHQLPDLNGSCHVCLERENGS